MAPRGQGVSIHSKRFGYMDSYTDKEQSQLICPSGFSFKQGIGKLYKLWWSYRFNKRREDFEKMMSAAKKIQEVQKDLGLKTTSFPHLGLYGDILMLYEKKNQKAVNEDHSELKASQELLEKKQEVLVLADKMNKILKERREPEQRREPEERREPEQRREEPSVPLLLTPTAEQEIQIFTDDIPVVDEEPKPLKLKLKLKESKKRKIKHDNRICIKCGEKLELELNHECKCKQEKEVKKELEMLVMTDDIPFQAQYYPQPAWVEEP